MARVNGLVVGNNSDAFSPYGWRGAVEQFFAGIQGNLPVVMASPQILIGEEGGAKIVLHWCRHSKRGESFYLAYFHQDTDAFTTDGARPPKLPDRTIEAHGTTEDHFEGRFNRFIQNRDLLVFKINFEGRFGHQLVFWKEQGHFYMVLQGRFPKNLEEALEWHLEEL